jgi:hypothetical protein
MAVTTTEKLNALIEADVISHGDMVWGNGIRQGFAIFGRRYQYKMGGSVSKNLENGCVLVSRVAPCTLVTEGWRPHAVRAMRGKPDVG